MHTPSTLTLKYIQVPTDWDLEHEQTTDFYDELFYIGRLVIVSVKETFEDSQCDVSKVLPTPSQKHLEFVKFWLIIIEKKSIKCPMVLYLM